jgi:hypothetical protein
MFTLAQALHVLPKRTSCHETTDGSWRSSHVAAYSRKNGPGTSRACNPWLRKPTPYPVGHVASCVEVGKLRHGIVSCVVFASMPWHRIAHAHRITRNKSL